MRGTAKTPKLARSITWTAITASISTSGRKQAIELLSAANEKYQLGYQLRFFLDNGPEGIYILQNAISPGDPAILRTASLAPDQMMADAWANSPATVSPATLRSSLWTRVRGWLLGK